MRNFDKKIVITMFLFFLFNVVAFGEIVNEFQIKGNERVSKDSIKMFSNIKVGDDINKNDLNQILKDIYDTNFFENVKVSLENKKKLQQALTLILQEYILETSKLIGFQLALIFFFYQFFHILRLFCFANYVKLSL